MAQQLLLISSFYLIYFLFLIHSHNHISLQFIDHIGQLFADYCIFLGILFLFSLGIL